MELELEINDVKIAYRVFKQMGGTATIDLSWAIDDIIEVLLKHVERADEKQKQIYAKYGELRSQVGSNARYSIKRENMAAHAQEIEELGKTKVKIEFSQLDYDVIEAQGITFSPADSKILRKFIVRRAAVKDKEEEKKPEKKSATIQEKAKKSASTAEMKVEDKSEENPA